MREANLKTTQAMLDAGITGNFEAVKQYLHPDFVVIEADSLPYAGTFPGFEGYVHVMSSIPKTWQDVQFEVIQIMADDTSVAIRMRLAGRRGSRTFDMPICEVWDFKDGKVVKAMPFYFDTKLLADIYAETK